MTEYIVIRNNAGKYFGGLARGWVTLRCHARKWPESERAHAVEFLGYLGMGARLVRVPDDFFSERHRRIFEAACALSDEGAPIDVVLRGARAEKTE